jgi:hypothetical protein
LLSFFGNIPLRQRHDLSNRIVESMRPGIIIVADHRGAVHRTVLHWRLGQKLPDGRYGAVIKHDCGDQVTNWQYTAARQFIAGLGQTPKSP